MRNQTFKKLLGSLNRLNNYQYRQLKATIKSLDFKNKVALNIEADYKEVTCPYCHSTKKQRWGKRSGLQRYRCKKCKKTFNSLTGTPLARLRKKEQWLDYAACLKEGLSVRKAAVRCKVHYNTTFKWRHRFLVNAKFITPPSLNGIVEAEETYFRYSEKGTRKLARKPRKRGEKTTVSGHVKERVCVLFCRDRNTNTIDKIFNSFNCDRLEDALNKLLSKDALFCSDGRSVYKQFAIKNHIRHGCLNLSAGQRVVKDIVHIQNVDSYHTRLREWLVRFHGVATKYLENYLAWFRELDEFEMQIKPETLLIRGKQGMEYKVQPFIVI